MIEGKQWIYGHPAPTAIFKPGESRLLTTTAKASGPGQKTAKGFIGAKDMSGARFYLCTVTGGRRVYRLRGWRRAKNLSDQALIDELYPGEFEIKSMKCVPYETVERSL